MDATVSIELKPELILRAGQRNVFETCYYVDIDIGVPAQKFRASFHINSVGSAVAMADRWPSSNVLYDPISHWIHKCIQCVVS